MNGYPSPLIVQASAIRGVQKLKHDLAHVLCCSRAAAAAVAAVAGLMELCWWVNATQSAACCFLLLSTSPVSPFLSLQIPLLQTWWFLTRQLLVPCFWPCLFLLLLVFLLFSLCLSFSILLLLFLSFHLFLPFSFSLLFFFVLSFVVFTVSQFHPS